MSALAGIDIDAESSDNQRSFVAHHACLWRGDGAHCLRLSLMPFSPSRIFVATLALWPLLCVPSHAQTTEAKPVELLTSFSNTLGMKMLPVPGTTVLFAEFETRVSDFEAYVKAGHPWSFRPHFEQTGGHPAVGANLRDALAFCNWLTETEQKQGKIKPNQLYRLPTNEEWSAAAGLGAERQQTVATQDRMAEVMRFPWGQAWPPPPGAGNFQEKEIPGYDDGYPFTSPVGKFTPSADGLYDLAGNVWEWTWDRQLSAAPTGTLRGGCWAYFKRETLTASYIYSVPADLRALTIGFRCVFEDKERTALLLAAMSADRLKAEQQKKKELTQKPKIDATAMKKKLAGEDADKAVGALPPAQVGAKFRNALKMEFVPVKALPGLLIGSTEVTVGNVNAWTSSGAHPAITQPHFNESLNDPVVNVSWQDAQAFCDWLTKEDQERKLLPPGARYRLPTDQEWSSLAGLSTEIGTDPAQKHLQDKTQYPWGTEWPPRALGANLDAPRVPGFRDSFAYTAPVGSTTANAEGLFDLGGNVSEWCADAWPDNANQRVVRGGSWIMSAQEAVLASARQHPMAESIRYDLGFRCVIDFGK
jgi:formylglycine-generating enzyme required for sulfatase activity